MSATALVDIFVSRNLFVPTFLPDNSRLEVHIPENSQPGKNITVLSVEDGDKDVSIGVQELRSLRIGKILSVKL